MSFFHVWLFFFVLLFLFYFFSYYLLHLNFQLFLRLIINFFIFLRRLFVLWCLFKVLKIKHFLGSEKVVLEIIAEIFWWFNCWLDHDLQFNVWIRSRLHLFEIWYLHRLVDLDLTTFQDWNHIFIDNVISNSLMPRLN